jgi:hypothetical protein
MIGLAHLPDHVRSEAVARVREDQGGHPGSRGAADGPANVSTVVWC